MFATEIASYVLLLKLEVMCIFVIVLSLIAFIHNYLAPGSRWIALLIAGLWGVAMVVNVFSPTSVVFGEITELTRSETFWGETFTLARGKPNPWKLCADVATVAILIYLLQATFRAWQHGRQERALIVGGGSVFFMILGGVQAPLVDAGILQTPYMVSFAYLAIVGALSYQLVNDALRANEYARELDKLTPAVMLGEVAAGLAHELNQPLAAILSNAQAGRRFMSNDTVDTEEIRQILDDIIADDKRASGVINGLLSMLRPHEVVVEAVDVGAAIRSVADLLAGELHANQVRLETNISADMPRVLADEVQVQQVLINLATNAIHAMDNTPVDQRALALTATAKDNHVHVAVADNGPGIANDVLPRVFEPFFSTSQHRRLGMGLAICRRIVERFDGRIFAESPASGGAILRFELPVETQSTRNGSR